MSSFSGVKAGRAFVEIGAVDKASEIFKTVGDKLKNLGSLTSSLGQSLYSIATKITQPLFSLAQGFSNQGDSIAKMAKRTGIAVESLSALAFAAEQSGSNITDVEIGIKTMQRILGNAAKDLTTNNQSLEILGLNLATLQKLSPEQQFLTIAEALSKIKDPTKQAAIALGLFGKSGTKLLPLIQEGGAGINKLMEEAKTLGRVLSEDDAKSAEELNDAFGRLTSMINGLKMQIGAALAPMLTNLLETIKPIMQAILQWVSDNRDLARIIFIVVSAIAGVGASLIVLGPVIGGIGSAFTGLATAISLVTTGIGAFITFLASPPGLALLGVFVALAGVLYTFPEILDYITQHFANFMANAFTVFNEIRSIALTAIGGILAALKAGNAQLAGQIFMVGLKVGFLTGINPLRTIFDNFIKYIFDSWTGLKFGLAQLIVEMWTNIKQVWLAAQHTVIEITLRMMEFILTTIGTMLSYALTKLANTLAALPGTDEIVGKIRNSAEVVKHLGQGTREERLYQQKEYQRKGQAIHDEGQATSDELGKMQAEELNARAKHYKAREDERQGYLDDAKAQLEELVSQAHEEASSLANAPPELKQLATEQLAFNALDVLGFDSSSPTSPASSLIDDMEKGSVEALKAFFENNQNGDEQLKLQRETAKNTKRIADSVEDFGLGNAESI